MSDVLNSLVDQRAIIVYVIVGVVVFAEDALFFGFILPGETAAILGGVSAGLGHVNIYWMSAIVVVAAILGDTVGYEIGSRWGYRLLGVKWLRRREKQVESARAFLARRGGPAVFLGRFIAFLRAFVPFLAGVSHMHYRRFLAYNAAGGVVWGVGSVLIGYLAGNSYQMIEGAIGKWGAIAIAAVVVAGLIAWAVYRRVRERRSQ
ncbi:DedA family protein [Asanoa sp. WMMD1127]|uniref:DedA family protein n=1 Tax=Asanoa sp. WMMD1127 TaxID=3016107 RepID=UPI00241664EE|nr:DedA family protein [Asanoa sp. WMMD1127]MDG4823006.1 DedA family protein [Asanoa sp. WMMD1127]